MLAKDEAFRNKVNLTVSNLQSILQRADEGKGTIGKLLHDPTLIRQQRSDNRGNARTSGGNSQRSQEISCDSLAHFLEDSCSESERPSARSGRNLPGVFFKDAVRWHKYAGAFTIRSGSNPDIKSALAVLRVAPKTQEVEGYT